MPTRFVFYCYMHYWLLWSVNWYQSRQIWVFYKRCLDFFIKSAKMWVFSREVSPLITKNRDPCNFHSAQHHCVKSVNSDQDHCKWMQCRKECSDVPWQSCYLIPTRQSTDISLCLVGFRNIPEMAASTLWRNCPKLFLDRLNLLIIYCQSTKEFQAPPSVK